MWKRRRNCSAGNTCKRHLDTDASLHPNASSSRAAASFKRSKAIQQQFLMYDRDRNSFCKVIKGAQKHMDFFKIKQLCMQYSWDKRGAMASAWWTSEPCTCRYAYGGRVNHAPQEMPAEFQALLSELERAEGLAPGYFNSILGNWYETGATLQLHADDEKLFGAGDTTIASWSFGATRTFTVEDPQTGQTWHADLQHGDLVLMKGAMQKYYRHGLPVPGPDSGVRINLTARHIECHSPEHCTLGH